MHTVALEAEAGIWIQYPKSAAAWFSSLDAKIMHVHYKVA